MSQAQTAQPMGCLIEPQQAAELGTQVIRVVEKMLLNRVGRVSQTQVMTELRGEIESASLLDKLTDASSNTVRVQLELPNSNLSLPAVLRCLADFEFRLLASGGQQAQVLAKAKAVWPAIFEPLTVERSTRAVAPKTH